VQPGKSREGVTRQQSSTQQPQLETAFGATLEVMSLAYNAINAAASPVLSCLSVLFCSVLGMLMTLSMHC